MYCDDISCVSDDSVLLLVFEKGNMVLEQRIVVLICFY